MTSLKSHFLLVYLISISSYQFENPQFGQIRQLQNINIKG